MSDMNSVNIRLIDSTILLVFLGTMRHRKATVVAEEMGLTQPAVSHALKRLRELRRPDGGYAWWPTSTEPSPWITLHAYRALRMAEAEGYAVGDLNGLERYLLANVTRYYPRLRLQIQNHHVISVLRNSLGNRPTNP